MTKQLSLYLTLALMLVVSAARAQDSRTIEELARQGFEIINVENDGVKAFMADRTYDQPEYTGRYSMSVVKRYTGGVGSSPRGKSVSWTPRMPREDLADLVVTLSESERFDKNVKFYYPVDTLNSYTICNMVPGTKYYYKVEEVSRDKKRVTVANGKFYTTGKVRMLRVGGMFNVRDFGGWDTSFGVKVKYGRIFRGNHPRTITEVGKNDFVENEHITADLELTGVQREHSPMGPSLDFFSTNNARYKSGLTTTKRALRDDLIFISQVLMSDGNVFLHCNHGVNRAGTLSFLVDGLLGLSEADLSRTYELSSFAYGTTRNATYGEMLPVIRSCGEPGDDLTQCFYNYCRKIGVSEEELDIIRCTMLGLDWDDPRIEGAHRDTDWNTDDFPPDVEADSEEEDKL